MPINRALADTSFAYAIYDIRDLYHEEAVIWMDANPKIQLLLPDVVLIEAVYLIRRSSKHDMGRVVTFLKDFLPSIFQFESVLAVDIERASEIMAQYLDAKLDVVDCIISAQAERLNISQICTFDRRDFAMMKPRHTPYFELLP